MGTLFSLVCAIAFICAIVFGVKTVQKKGNRSKLFLIISVVVCIISALLVPSDHDDAAGISAPPTSVQTDSTPSPSPSQTPTPTPSPSSAPSAKPTDEPAKTPTPSSVPANTPTPEQTTQNSAQQTAAPVSTPVPTPAPPTNQGTTIYVTETGKRYHYDPNCNGGTYYPSTLDAALARGLTPCQKCVGG